MHGHGGRENEASSQHRDTSCLPPCLPPFPPSSAGGIRAASPSPREEGRYELCTMVQHLQAMRRCQQPFLYDEGYDAFATSGEFSERLQECCSATDASFYSESGADDLLVGLEGAGLESRFCLSMHRIKRVPLVPVYSFPFFFLLSFSLFTGFTQVNSACLPSDGCDALAFYVVPERYNASFISRKFFGGVPFESILKYNTDVQDIAYLQPQQELRIPFHCGCIDGTLNMVFFYEVQTGDTLMKIASSPGHYQNLTKEDWIRRATPLSDDSLVPSQRLKIPVNCSCGTANNKMYGLFLTYPARLQDTGDGLAKKYGVSVATLELYNPGTNLSNLEANTILFIPAKDGSDKYPKFHGKYILSPEESAFMYVRMDLLDTGGQKGGSNTGLLVGAVIGGACLVLLCSVLVVCCLCCWPYSRGGSKAHEDLESHPSVEGSEVRMIIGAGSKPVSNISMKSSGTLSDELPPDLKDYKSVEFSYEELAAATNNFDVANKIGEGGYGAVYLANLRGQRLAVKRMNLQATREFMAELQVLTHVHHTNLVQLIGYCTVDSLFLIYEFVENGNLADHLRRSVKGAGALTWVQRVQIALDAARGLEYIHEHTKPTYIHRDVKSSNILIDKNYRAKVADFGLTKLTESNAGSISLTLPTRLVGTFGYMSPEYARFGDVSPMVDVYSFGVVLLEILSAKEAIVREDASSSSSSGLKEQRGLVTLFESILKAANGKALLKNVMDPALDNNYPPEAAWKMAQLAGMCTKEIPELRPTMRVVVVALMTLPSSSQS